ncbi:MAG: hypothetical protein COZ34_02185 [Candidatus Pacebacteria bacterium CG_4_10_14_3_um_filter_34_15]|nr:hypothetical protein [Candidatus Pacearchaeota archaeon]NCQ65992.1 hypothetical protein [Candidatus Paceibacterota bacterium]OIO43759.1 MAG: hypothetical protein AUJ41_04400 [Candidatus Pacebacteria bacterium CG1_02_43_31]PIQ80610.1 MAG: hypothetical protein COV78_04750 [Candidatus Pacebacteria bacterium CG11_big_fil_rev_8_21_14_0_20_34_55]PIX81635.1 MAG: hypothetical protein COZ34_02185 [Candidatus Pacebacteria bacterium CG_4_10_14_3_um_filter_34_15]PJC43381.1 MAG: hypothetical protein CO0
MEVKDNKLFNTIVQVAIPVLTISVQIAIAMKLPQWGLVINMLAQPFWIYSAWKAYKQAGQIGLLITTVLVTIVIALGLINYWLI